MYFGLTEEQLALSRGAREGLRTIGSRDSISDVWARLVEGGWHDIPSASRVSRKAVALDTALVAEEASSASLPLSFTDHCVVPAAVARVARDGGIDEVVSSDLWTVAGAEAAVDGLRGHAPIVAQRHGSTWRLTGTAHHVQAANAAARLLVVALDAESEALVTYAITSAADMSITDLNSLDFLCPAAVVSFVNLPASPVGSSAGIDILIDWGTLGTCAELLGAAESLRDMSVEYAKQRSQFGKPIGSFQAVKHHCANMHIRVEAMRVAVWNAAMILDARPSEASYAVSMAKAYCAPAAIEVAQWALQVHGGIGFTWEHPLHQHLKRIARLVSAYGDATWHRERMAHSQLDGLSLATNSPMRS